MLKLPIDIQKWFQINKISIRQTMCKTVSRINCFLHGNTESLNHDKFYPLSYDERHLANQL